MKKIFSSLAAGALVLIVCSPLGAATKTSAVSGSWASAATWSPSGTPGPNDIVIIASGTTVTITTNETASDLTIQSGGVLRGDGAPRTFSIGKGGGEDLLNNGLLDANGTIVRLQKNSQWSGTGVCKFSTLDLNTKSLIFTAGASLTIQLATAGNPITNTGTISGISTVTFEYNGTASQTLSSAAGVVYGSLKINNAAGVSLTSNKSIGGTLVFSAGCLLLGTYDLTLAAAVSGAGSGKCIVTNGTGVVQSPSILGGQSFQFPVAPTTSSFNPVTIASSVGDTAEVFSVRVSSTVNPTSPDNSLAVQRTWHITEATPGSNNGALTFGWVNAEHGVNFSAIPGQGVYRHNGSAYQLVSTLGSPGSSPYSSTTISTVNTFSSFVVGQAGGLPVQLASFTGSVVRENSARLNWRTISEVNNYGFFVQLRRLDEPGNGVWLDVANGFIPGHGTTNAPHDYSFMHTNVVGATWQYRLKQVDLDGTDHFSEPIELSVPTSVREQGTMQFSLHHNYPNPFNPTTTVNYELPTSQFVSLKVFDVAGREVATLVNKVQQPGNYAAEWNAENLPSGVYFYRLGAGSFVATKKLVLAK